MAKIFRSDAVDIGLDQLADLLLDGHVGQQRPDARFDGRIGPQGRRNDGPLVGVHGAPGLTRRSAGRGVIAPTEDGCGAEEARSQNDRRPGEPNNGVSHEFERAAAMPPVALHELSSASHLMTALST